MPRRMAGRLTGGSTSPPTCSPYRAAFSCVGGCQGTSATYLYKSDAKHGGNNPTGFLETEKSQYKDKYKDEYKDEDEDKDEDDNKDESGRGPPAGRGTSLHTRADSDGYNAVKFP